MQAIEFNTGWTWRHPEDKGPGTAVTLPHDAMLYEERREDFPGGANIGWYEGRDYVYEKRFRPEEDWEGKRLVLEFEGVYRDAEVSLNGQKIGSRPYGYTNFYVDLTGRLIPGRENVLQVLARNSSQPNSRWYSGAGIYRPVKLWLGGAAHIALNGVRIRTTGITPPAVEIRVATSLPGQAKVEIFDGESLMLATSLETRQVDEAGPAVGSSAITLAEAGLWHPDHPQLYTCRVTFGDDAVDTVFGIRSLEWGEDGILLNGERVILQGACIHHDNGILGACCYPEAVERKVRLLKETGYNALRSAHNPCSKALLEACDRLGMLVMDEYIDHWYIHKTQYDYVPWFDQWWRMDLTDMVEKDYNHPCVILYSTGNEVSETAQKRGIALTGEMTEFLHTLDSSRPVTCGVNIFFNFLSSIGMGVYSDDKAKAEAERAEKARAAGKKVKKKDVGSEFFNNLAGLLGDEFMKRGATLRGCDLKTRDAFANMDVAGYNYGIYRYEKDLKRYPNRLILGSETFCKDAYRFRELAKREPRLLGDFVWSGIDYLGEVGIGSWEYSDYAPAAHVKGWVSAGSGRLDLIGNPLGEALYTKVALEKEAGPLMAVCPVNHTGERHSPSAWKMSNALPTWNWRGCEGRKARVEVYARAAAVELRLNGKTVGRKALKNTCLAPFTLRWAPGVLEAVSYDSAGEVIGTCQLTSQGQETRLVAEPEAGSVRAGGLVFVRLRYVDEYGCVLPLERSILRVTVKGGKLAGLGSACPYNEIGYIWKRTGTYFGEAMAVIRASEGEQVELTVSDGKLTGTAVIPVEG